MKKVLSLTLITLLTVTLLLTGCIGQKKIDRIDVGDTLVRQYEQGSTPDFSGVKATIVYNDASTLSVDASKLEFSTIDTSKVGKQTLTITYEGFSEDFVIEIIKKADDTPRRELTKIEYVSGIPTNIFVGDTFHYENISIKAIYSDNTEEIISLSKNSSVKYTTIDINTAGKQTITFTYMNLTCTAEVNIQAIKVIGIEVDYSSVVDGVDVDTIVVKKLFNTGTSFPVSAEDLTITQNGDIYTITYHDANDGDFSVTIDSSVTPVIERIEILTTGYENSVVIAGDTVSTSGVTCKAHYSNGASASLTSAEFTCSAVDASVAGDATLTVTYNDNTDITATATITVLGITKVSINAGSVKNVLTVGSSIDPANVEVSILCSDGSTVVRKADEVDLSNLNTSAANKDSYITATINGVKSEVYSIAVIDANAEYTVLDASLPASIANLTSKKDKFINKSYGYYVGDDNPFILKLEVIALDSEGNLPDNQEDVVFRSHFELYLDGVQLTGDELSKYASFNADKHTVQFTSEAVGKEFTIKVCPEGKDFLMKELTVNVVDGLNIYEAWELNYLTNMDNLPSEAQAKYGVNQLTAVDNFLATKGATRPTGLGAIIIHNDLTIERTDIPAEYYIDKNNVATAEFWDVLTIFPHANDAPDGEFEVYGNYYSIFSWKLPPVCKEGTGNQIHDKPESYAGAVSNGQLFRFSSAAGEAAEDQGWTSDSQINFNHKDYKTTLHSFHLMDDDENNNEEWRTERSMRGLIGMKLSYQDVYAENINIEAFYISFFLDYDYLTANVNECTFYNSYQNHIYIFNKNLLLHDNDAVPGANHQHITLNVTASKITKTGAPVILTQSGEPKLPKNAKSGHEVNISKDTEIWTLVTGQETWFTAMGQFETVQAIITLNESLYKNFGNSFVTDTGEIVNMKGNYVNLIMASLDAELAGSDVDGSFSIVDGESKTTYLDMNDTYDADGNLTGYYTNPYVNQCVVGSGGLAPVLNTCTGGILMYKGGLDFDTFGTDALLAGGDYIALYQNGMGVVLGLNGANNAIERLPAPIEGE